ncbi:MAG: HyaD/HybD family hydrogenase maturation endopeptidase [Actinomycetota bacterium]|nr:HyaD/HybD family hydrogenase maturation endopeptidase [Actinomycetota bacterium]
MTEKSARKIVVLGAGNILLRDEGIGVHVIREMEKMDLPPNVELLDGGTLGIDILNLIEGADKLIIVDAVKTEAETGAIFRFRPEDIKTVSKGYKTSLHQIDLFEALKIAKLMDQYPESIVIGVQPGKIEWGLELFPELRERIPAIIDVVLEEIAKG